jgi:SagB-type dehydrogenase family enzyme
MHSATDCVRAYQQRSKHQLQRYATGPDTLDWDAQPSGFRHWPGAPLLRLPLVADAFTARWADLFVPGRIAPAPLKRRSVAALLELSFGLTAWKRAGPDRWPLRANPSSGNLHPVEAYLLAQGVAGLDDGLHHYQADDHALALRARWPAGEAPAHPAGLWVGLSAIAWREAWKYGERAFRYCQLDLGHAVGALCHAAAVLGWQARVVDGIGHDELAHGLGLDRDGDFGTAEREEPALLLHVGPGIDAGERPEGWQRLTQWQGQASRLDARPMYRWPVIDEISRATRAPAGERDPAALMSEAAMVPAVGIPQARHAQQPAARLIRQRRSAQRFDRQARMPLAALLRIAGALMPQAGGPWRSWPHPARVHAVLWAHRVDGLAPGAYALPRSAGGARRMAEGLQTGTAWQAVPEAPAGVPLQCIALHPALAGSLRTLSCHQAIASDACVALSLVAEFDAIDAAPWCYRALYQEAGLMGQVLYLQAEAEGFSGTGIGCYFDDAVHELLGLQGHSLQVVYHFTLGTALTDARIHSEAAYADRDPVDDAD